MRPDGSFRITNIPAADFFGASGPGSAPDFRADDPLRVTGIGLLNGRVAYLQSDLFRIVNLPDVPDDHITRLRSFSTQNRPLPLPVAVRLTTPRRLVEVGEEVQLTATAFLVDDTAIDVTASSSGTVYRLGTSGSATLSAEGVLAARRAGAVTIAAVHQGVTAVLQLDVTTAAVEVTVEGFARLDGVPLAGATVTLDSVQANTEADGFFTMTFEVPFEELESPQSFLIRLDREDSEFEVPVSFRYSPGITDLGILDVQALPPPVTDRPALFEPREFDSGLNGLLAIEAFDGNGEGALDLLAAGEGISFLAARADGEFSEPLLVADVETEALAAGDIDGVGPEDFVASVNLEQEGLSAFQVFLASQPLSWEPAPLSSFETPGAEDGIRSLHLVDLDGQSDLDIVAVLQNLIVVFLASGDGQYVEVKREFVSSARVATADADGDGNQDVIGLSFFAGLFVYFGDGAGGFDEVSVAGVTGAPLVGRFAPGGVTGILSSGGTLVRFAPDRTFVQETVFSPGDLFSSAGNHVLADVDDDDRPDLCWLEFGNRRRTESIVGVLLDVQNAGSLGAVPLLHQAASDPFDLIAADLDADGDDDLASASISSLSIGVLRRAGEPDAARPPRLADGGSPTALAAADLDADGHVDAVVGRNIGGCRFGDLQGSLFVYAGSAGGSFTAEPVREIPLGESEVARDLTIVDLNRDGRLDLATRVQNSNSLTQYLVVLFGLPDGSLGARAVFERPAEGAFSSFLIDADGDGARDIALTSPANDTVHIVSSSGVGSLDVQAVTSVLPVAAVGDWDGDGDDDLVGWRSDQVIVSLSEAGGFEIGDELIVNDFAEAVALRSRPGQPAELVVLTCAGRGCPAVVEKYARSGDVFVREDTSIRGFGEFGSPSAIVMVDLDRDRQLDVLIQERFRFGLLRGLPDGRLGQLELYSPPASASEGPVAVDVDGDGDLDLLFYRSARETVVSGCQIGTGFAVLENQLANQGEER